jgi:hypothetical protein
MTQISKIKISFANAIGKVGQEAQKALGEKEK